MQKQAIQLIFLSFKEMSMKKTAILILAVLSFYNCEKLTNGSNDSLLSKSQNSRELYISELRILNNLDDGIKRAQLEHKPIFLIFLGWGQESSREIEVKLLMNNKSINKILRDDYINVQLYVDDKDFGKKWSEIQKETFKTTTIPYMIILDSEGKPISNGLNYDQAYESLEKELLKYKY